MEAKQSYEKFLHLSEGDDDLKIFFCPIKKDLMENPVIAADGIVSVGYLIFVSLCCFGHRLYI